jgi:3-oxoacyl-[acyl-carrier-protein] synthase-3
MTATRIAGIGSALPERVVTNEDLSGMVATSDEWVVSRTGIRSRRFASADETTSDFAALAAERALEAAGIPASDIDLTIVATISGDQPLPSTAAFVQSRLGTRGAAFDIGAACAGFVYGLEVAAAQLTTGASRAALVIGAETLSRFLDFTDRTTCVLFGDGAGAAVVLPGDEPGIIGSLLEADGGAATLLEIRAGGARLPASKDTVADSDHTIRMEDGREVFKRAVTAMADASSRLLQRHGVAPDDLDLVVPHQANERIIRAVGSRLGIPEDRVFIDLEEVGNTSAASVPIALDRAWRGGRLSRGDLVLTVAFGAGLTWGANLLRWTEDPP